MKKIYGIDEKDYIAEIQPPTKFTYRNVMFWCPESRELVRLKKDGDKTAATLLTKAQKFLEFKCVKENLNGWAIMPIEGYNKTTHYINMSMECNCQGFNKKKKDEGKGYCSHCLAVEMFKFMEKEK